MLPHKPHDPPAPFRRPYERLSLEAPVLRYYASVSWFDAIVGELLGLLREKGRAERTLVVFLVDNGWAPRRDDVPRAAPRTKNSPFEGGVRTPLLLHWPGRVRPGRREDLVSTIDVFPTLLEAAGRPPRPELPGVSLWPAATGEASVPRDAVMGAIYLHTARAVQPPAVNLLYRWIRQGAYKLIVPAQGTAAPAERDPQLFDLSADPAERRNLAARPSHRARLKTLRARLDAWWNPDPGSTP
jgi:uncharacterized sulfatase